LKPLLPGGGVTSLRLTFRVVLTVLESMRSRFTIGRAPELLLNQGFLFL